MDGIGAAIIFVFALQVSMILIITALIIITRFKFMKGRSKFISTIILLWILGDIMKAPFIAETGKRIHCTYVVLWFQTTLDFGVLFIFLLHAFRLFLIFTISNYKLSQLQSEKPDEKPRWWAKDSLYTDKSIAIMYLICMGFVQIIPLAATISAELHNDTEAKSCDSPTYQYLDYLLVLIVIALMIFMGWKLRKVHDAFFIKNELKLTVLIGLLIGIPAQIVSAYDDILGYLLYLTTYCFVLCFSFLLPMYFAWRNKDQRPFTHQTTNSTNSRSSNSVELQKDEEEPNDLDILREKEGSHAVEQFLLHYHAITLCHYVLLWNELQKYKAIQDPRILTGKAWLLFNKYLEKDSYIHVPCLSETEREEMKKKLEKIVDNLDKDELPAGMENFFDGVLKHVESTLYMNVIIPFNKSVFYTQYQKKLVLKNIDTS